MPCSSSRSSVSASGERRARPRCSACSELSASRSRSRGQPQPHVGERGRGRVPVVDHHQRALGGEAGRRRTRSRGARAAAGAWSSGPRARPRRACERSRISPSVAVEAPRSGTAGAPGQSPRQPVGRRSRRAGRRARPRLARLPRWPRKKPCSKGRRAARSSSAARRQRGLHLGRASPPIVAVGASPPPTAPERTTGRRGRTGAPGGRRHPNARGSRRRTAGRTAGADDGGATSGTGEDPPLGQLGQQAGAARGELGLVCSGRDQRAHRRARRITSPRRGMSRTRPAGHHPGSGVRRSRSANSTSFTFAHLVAGGVPACGSSRPRAARTCASKLPGPNSSSPAGGRGLTSTTQAWRPSQTASTPNAPRTPKRAAISPQTARSRPSSSACSPLGQPRRHHVARPLKAPRPRAAAR